MARLGSLLIALSLGLGPVFADDEGPAVVPGIITANNVDVTTDSGELLDQRLNIGDPIFIVVNPKKKRKGWVRISKSETDTAGFGWVEEKFTRSFRKWESAPSGSRAPSPAEMSGEKTVFAPDVEPTGYSRVGVVPFEAAEAGDSVARSAYDTFSNALKRNSRLTVNVGDLRGEKVNLEEPETIESVILRHKLDGVFVGSVSGDMGGGKLLQVRFYAKGREGAVLEKVKKLPQSGSLKEVIDPLVVSCTQAILGR